MNGRSVCLKRGMEVVVDTQLLVETAQRRREKLESKGEPSAGEENDIIDCITTSCAKLVLSVRQQKKESSPHFRSAGFNLPFQQVEYFAELENKEKLLKARKSSIVTFSRHERKAFEGRGHDNVTDDVHLYECAAACSGIVITTDSNLLRRSRDLYKVIRVKTLSPYEIQKRDTEEHP